MQVQWIYTDEWIYYTHRPFQVEENNLSKNDKIKSRMKTGAIYKKQVYQILSKGKFISQLSRDSQTRILYENIQENENEYRSYFEDEGLVLDHGRGYYQFCFDEVAENVSSALAIVKKYISIFTILIAWRGDIGPGDEFSKKDFIEAATDEDLKKELMGFMRRESYRDVINEIIYILRTDGIIEKFQKDDIEKYYVTSAYNYLEDLYNNIKIYNEEL